MKTPKESPKISKTAKNAKTPKPRKHATQKFETETATVPEKKWYKNILSALGFNFFVAAMFFVSAFISTFAASIILGSERTVYLAGNSPLFSAIYSVIIFGLTLAFVIYLPRKTLNIKTTLKEIGLIGLPTWTDILLAPVGYIVANILAVILVNVASGFMNFDVNQTQEGIQDISSLRTQLDYVLTFLTLVVLAPIVEEVLFRGYLYSKTRRYLGMVASSLIVSAVFGALHGQWNVGIVVFAMSVVCCFIREKITGTIWASVLTHMLRNGLAFYILYVNPSLLSSIGE